jgi:hypothetical protein
MIPACQQTRLHPVAGQILKNFLFKTISYFECDYAAFIHQSPRTQEQVFLTVASHERLPGDQLDMVRGMFLLPFFCNSTAMGQDTDIATIEYYKHGRPDALGRNAVSAGDYRYMHLVDSHKLQGLVGIGCFDENGMVERNAEWNTYSQFLNCSGAALLQRL